MGIERGSPKLGQDQAHDKLLLWRRGGFPGVYRGRCSWNRYGSHWRPSISSRAVSYKDTTGFGLCPGTSEVKLSGHVDCTVKTLIDQEAPALGQGYLAGKEHCPKIIVGNCDIVRNLVLVGRFPPTICSPLRCLQYLGWGFVRVPFSRTTG
jgi:hypothetical protein